MCKSVVKFGAEQAIMVKIYVACFETFHKFQIQLFSKTFYNSNQFQYKYYYEIKQLIFLFEYLL